MTKVIPDDFTILVPRGSTNETARCRLRRPSIEDIPDIFAATRFTGFNDGMRWEAPTTMAELEEPFRKNARAWDTGTAFTFTIADLSSNRLLGRIGIRRTDLLDVWDLGFWTHPEYQGQGYMTEAAIAIIAFGFDRLNATDIEASYALWNHSSKRVMEKIGMKFVAYIPHSFIKKGQWVESNKMNIDRQEWLTLNLNQSSYFHSY
jgi:[ribosomal protein S5]-alanine N-acetyltransferase